MKFLKDIDTGTDRHRATFLALLKMFIIASVIAGLYAPFYFIYGEASHYVHHLVALAAAAAVTLLVAWLSDKSFINLLGFVIYEAIRFFQFGWLADFPKAFGRQATTFAYWLCCASLVFMLGYANRWLNVEGKNFFRTAHSTGTGGTTTERQSPQELAALEKEIAAKRAEISRLEKARPSPALSALIAQGNKWAAPEAARIKRAAIAPHAKRLAALETTFATATNQSLNNKFEKETLATNIQKANFEADQAKSATIVALVGGFGEWSFWGTIACVFLLCLHAVAFPADRNGDGVFDHLDAVDTGTAQHGTNTPAQPVPLVAQQAQPRTNFATQPRTAPAMSANTAAQPAHVPHTQPPHTHTVPPEQPAAQPPRTIVQGFQVRKEIQIVTTHFDHGKWAKRARMCWERRNTSNNLLKCLAAITKLAENGFAVHQKPQSDIRLDITPIGEGSGGQQKLAEPFATLLKPYTPDQIATAWPDFPE